MIIGANDIRVGQLLNYNKRLCVVYKTQHVQPGKGGAYMQVEMKDIKEGTKYNNRFRSSETVEKVSLDERDFQFVYASGDMLELMDKATYEQISVSKELVGDNAAFLQDGMDVKLEYYGEEAIAVKLPDTTVVGVTECEPVVKGQTASSSYKPAILENGVRIMVPPFVNSGDRVVVRIDTKEYMERAK